MSRADPRYEICLIGALNTQTFLVEAAVTVPSTTESAFLDQYHIILFRMFAARHTGKFFCHNHTPFRAFDQFLKK